MKSLPVSLPDFAILILREEMPSADSCGDPFLEKHTEGSLPMGCGSETIFNFNWDKELELNGSGDDDSENPRPVTTIIPTRALLSTASQHHRTQSTKIIGVGVVSVTPKKLVSRLPPRFTPSPERRQSSFQQLLRLHLNSFNRRLTMLESNTLDMKDSIHSMEKQQSLLSSQLKDVISLQTASEKNKKVSELEKSYTEMEARLSRLEGRLEILIDGFTALAQEMNKMKRTRHISRSLQEKRVLPSLTTVIAVPLHSTPQPQVRVIPTKMSLTSKATVPKSIPTPGLLSNKHKSAPKTDRKVQSVKNTTNLQSVNRSFKNQSSARSTVRLKTSQSKPNTNSESTPQTVVKPQTKKLEGRRAAVTPKHNSQPRQTKLKEVKEEATITKFQVDPPPHNSKPAKIPQLQKQSDRANKKDPALLNINNGRKKTVIADATKKAPESVKTSEDDSKKLPKPHKGSSNPDKKKTEHKFAHKLPSHKTKNSTKVTVTATKTVKATTAKKPKTTVRRTTLAQINATSPKKKSNITIKRTSSPTKSKAVARKKNTKKHHHKKKKYFESGVLDLLRLLNGDSKSAKQSRNQEGSLHIVLGKLAIPIKIIPDD